MSSRNLPAMSQRLILKQTGLTYEPPDAPGIVVEYTFHPAEPGRIGARRENCEPSYPAWVEIETITAGGVDISGWLDAHGFETDKLSEGILTGHRE